MNQKEIFLCKYGEIVLKGANRQTFESQLVKELRRRACPHGIFKIYFSQSSIYVEPQDEFCDMDDMYEGFVSNGIDESSVPEKVIDDFVKSKQEFIFLKCFIKFFISNLLEVSSVIFPQKQDTPHGH